MSFYGELMSSNLSFLTGVNSEYIAHLYAQYSRNPVNNYPSTLYTYIIPQKMQMRKSKTNNNKNTPKQYIYIYTNIHNIYIYNNKHVRKNEQRNIDIDSCHNSTKTSTNYLATLTSHLVEPGAICLSK